MLFYSNLKSRDYCEEILNDGFIPLLKTYCPDRLTKKIFATCNLLYIRETHSINILLPELIRDIWVVSPRSEQYFDEMVLFWHSSLDKACLERDYYYTPEQQQLIDQLPPVARASSNLLIKKLISYFENEGVSKDKLEEIRLEAEKHALSKSLTRQNMIEQIHSLAPKDEDKKYLHKFFRTVYPQIFNVDDPNAAIALPNVHIDLSAYSELLKYKEFLNYWGIEYQNNCYELIVSESSEEYNKPLIRCEVN